MNGYKTVNCQDDLKWFKIYEIIETVSIFAFVFRHPNSSPCCSWSYL